MFLSSLSEEFFFLFFLTLHSSYLVLFPFICRHYSCYLFALSHPLPLILSDPDLPVIFFSGGGVGGITIFLSSVILHVLFSHFLFSHHKCQRALTLHRRKYTHKVCDVMAIILWVIDLANKSDSSKIPAAESERKYIRNGYRRYQFCCRNNLGPGFLGLEPITLKLSIIALDQYWAAESFRMLQRENRYCLQLYFFCGERFWIILAAFNGGA